MSYQIQDHEPTYFNELPNDKYENVDCKKVAFDKTTPEDLQGGRPFYLFFAIPEDDCRLVYTSSETLSLIGFLIRMYYWQNIFDLLILFESMSEVSAILLNYGIWS